MKTGVRIAVASSFQDGGTHNVTNMMMSAMVARPHRERERKKNAGNSITNLIMHEEEREHANNLIRRVLYANVGTRTR
ncbi:hypothetical protein NDU88_009427 [Pleurodeles waltl]|uniref:Uncharacterized protein n=1 Tax=Pleurodeles waltl TaxID=8319 RepID=A0AAV7PT85_PLEWA|nr:hypothetical protein NDU88_009427 [Pleurodeles waltl]